MTDDANSVRDYLHRSIQDTTTLDDNPGDSLNGAHLMGWVVIAEWMDPNGERWISMGSADATGEDRAADWQVKGYLTHALHEWPKDNE